MHLSDLTKTLFAAVFAASTAFAAAIPTDKSMMAGVPLWVMKSMMRTCDKADQVCSWTFEIRSGAAPPTACIHIVEADGKIPASQASGAASQCGGYTISSNWSGQFGAGKGFTTMAVIDNAERLIVWPAYSDEQVKKGKVIVPNQGYEPVNLP